MKYVEVLFDDKKFNYTTAVNPLVSDQDIKRYFIGTEFNLGSTRDLMRTCVDCIISYPKESESIKKIESKIDSLTQRLEVANERETEVFMNLGFGAGMRRNNINVSTRKSDALKEKIEILKTRLQTLKNTK